MPDDDPTVPDVSGADQHPYAEPVPEEEVEVEHQPAAASAGPFALLLIKNEETGPEMYLPGFGPHILGLFATEDDADTAFLALLEMVEGEALPPDRCPEAQGFNEHPLREAMGLPKIRVWHALGGHVSIQPYPIITGVAR